MVTIHTWRRDGEEVINYLVSLVNTTALQATTHTQPKTTVQLLTHRILLCILGKRR
jgi:hypothetical protein